MSLELSQPIEIDREKWSRIFGRFIEVLRINMFVLDAQGKSLLLPPVDGYGWRLLANSSMGLGLLEAENGQWLEALKKNAYYWEYKDDLDLHSFVVPIKLNEKGVAGYIVLGPVIFNRRLDTAEYITIAKRLNMNLDDLIDQIDEVRIISFFDLKSILDLLADVSGYMAELGLNRASVKPVLEKAVLAQKGQERDRLLNTFLESALAMTRLECGSIMLLDQESGELVVRAARGLNPEQLSSAHARLGEGISGLAAQENSAFVINEGQLPDNRIKHLLKRPEIKNSAVVPLTSRKDKVWGVLNLHTKNTQNKIEPANLQLLQNLSKFTETVLQNLL